MSSPLLSAARQLVRRGSFEEAEQCLLGALGAGADAAAAHELLGAVYLGQQRPDLAAEAARTAVGLDPDREGAYRHLARAQILLGNRQGALDALLEAIARQPGSVGFYLDAALLLRDLGAVEEALGLLDLAESRLPEARWEADHLRLDLLLWDRRYDAAAAAARELLQRYPDDLGALDYLVTTCSQLGDLDGAIEAAQQLLAVAPGVSHYALRLAGLLRDARRTQRAVALYQYISDAAENDECREEAREALALLDAGQIPVLLTMAAESRSFLRELQEDPITAALSHGFALSREGMAGLVAMVPDLAGGLPGQLRFH